MFRSPSILRFAFQWLALYLATCGLALANPLTCGPGMAGYVPPSQTGCSLSISTHSLPSTGGTVQMQGTCPSGSGWVADNFSVISIGPDGSYQNNGYDSWPVKGNATTSPITWQLGRRVDGPTGCSLLLANVVEANTYVTVAVSPNPANVNQAVTITATVHGASPTGTLNFFWYATNLCQGVSLVNGSGSCSYTPTATGTFTAGVTSYSGDSQNVGSQPSPVSVTVSSDSPPPTGTSTTLSSSLNPSQPGDNVTFTARVQSASGTPNGTVTFTDNGSSLCNNVSLSGGSAICSTSALTAGRHTIAAAYAGNATYPASSDSLSQTVGTSGSGGKQTTSTTLTATPNPVSAGSTLTLTATVSGSAPTGTVTFYADPNLPFNYGTTLCNAVALSSGTATCTNTTLPQGAHILIATYAGDANNQNSTSANVNLTVDPAGTTPPPAPKLTLSTSPNPSYVGQPVNFNLGLDSTLAGGVVRVAVDGAGFCTYVVPSTNVPSTATACSASALTAGSHTISATWAQDILSSPTQTATPVTQVVSAALPATTTTLTTNWSGSIAGHAVVLKALIAGNGPAGTVNFTNGTNSLCAAMPVRVIAGNSVAFCVAVLPTAGTFNLSAVYSGDSRNMGSTGSLTQTVYAAPALNEHQTGLTGAWGNAAGGGQGLLIDALPENNVLFIGWFTYDDAGHPRWYVLQGDLAGSPLTIYQGQGGNFNAPPKVPAEPIGSATLTFADCSHATLSYSFNDGSHPNGIMPIVRLMASPTCAVAGDSVAPGLDFGLSGFFYAPATGGQGLFFEVNPQRNLVFGAWYTYAQNGSLQGGTQAQRWYTFQGDFTPGSRTITNVAVYTGTGGVFNDPTPITTTQVGTATLTYSDCNDLRIDYSFTAGELAGIQSSVMQQRLGSTPAGCQ